MHCIGITCSIGNIRGSGLKQLRESEFLTSTSYKSTSIVASDMFNSAIESAASGESVRIKFELFWLTTDEVTNKNTYRNIS